MSLKKANKKWKQFNFDVPVLKCSEKKDFIDLTDELDDISHLTKDFNFEQKLAPKLIKDVAVHTKKIQEVEFWFQTNVLSSKDKSHASMLLLTGPTGCGKTITVKLLCKSMNIDLSEWINPVDKDFDLFHGPGQSTQLQEFLIESKYPSLFSLNKPKVALVEDYPNSVIRNPSEFVGILEKCYDSRSSFVFICTDASNNSLNLSRTLFPDEVRSKYSIANISFNPCSATLLKQALKRAQALVLENLATLKMPTPACIESISSSSMGDIRCAVNQFYFACLKGSDDLPTVLNKTISTAGTKRKRNGSAQSNVKNMLKDECLDLFHSLGRVLNPKWEEKDSTKRILYDLNFLIDELSIQPGTFNSFLHENYFKYFGDINDVCRAAEILSLSQIFLHNWSEKNSDTLMYALWLSVLGLMIFNEHKVSKWNQIRRPRNVQRIVNNDLETRQLPVADRCYYNVITKSDKYRLLNLP